MADKTWGDAVTKGNPPKTYICDCCGGEFEFLDPSEWSNEDAVKEYEASFSDEARQDERATICDDCYKDIMKWKHENG